MPKEQKHSDIYFDAGWMYEKIVLQIREFEEKLDDDSEAIVRLASFGSSITMSVDKIGYEDPHLLYFCGRVKGEEALLIQHMDQLNFLLVAEKKENPEKPPRRLGFNCELFGECAEEVTIENSEKSGEKE